MKASINKSVLIGIVMLTTVFSSSFAQNNNHYMRIAKIIVDSAQLENYKSALKEGISQAVKKEAGVLSLYAVYEKKQPTHVTVFEIYASEEAYKSHVQTEHFSKYKDTVKDMVKSLELVDVGPVALEAKKNVF